MKLAAAALLLVVALSSCSEARRVDNSNIDDITPDAVQFLELSQEQIEALSDKANAGDVKAAKSLYDHYLAKGDGRQVEHWESWLIERNDPDALGRRAEIQFLEARDLPDNDRAKLEILEQAADLNARAGRFHVPSEGPVLINGKPVDVSEEEKKAADEFTKSIRADLERVRSAQSH